MMTTTGKSDGQDVRIIAATPAWGMAEVNRVLLILWSDQPSLERFRQRNAELELLAERFPGRCALVEVVEPGVKAPESEIRVAVMEVFPKLGSNLACIAFVFEGNELRATLNRAVMTGMTFLSPQVQPTKFFKTLDTTTAWVKERISEADEGFGDRLGEAVARLRAAVHGK